MTDRPIPNGASRRSEVALQAAYNSQGGLAMTDLTAESLFSAPVWFPTAGDPKPLVTGGAA